MKKNELIPFFFKQRQSIRYKVSCITVLYGTLRTVRTTTRILEYSSRLARQLSTVDRPVDRQRGHHWVVDDLEQRTITATTPFQQYDRQPGSLQ